MAKTNKTNKINKINKAKKTNKTRFGIFYRSNGRWTTSPYAGVTFTKYTLGLKPMQDDISWLRNYVLKSRVAVKPVITVK